MNTVIGIDYGTQSARALLIDCEDGSVLCSHSIQYPHGVMEGSLASIEDYEMALEELLQAVTPVRFRSTIRGICVDATSLTLVPLAADGMVLCRLPEFSHNPHAQIKLWKRHDAQPQAEEALKLAKEMNCGFLKRTGGMISSEWMLPKLLETRDKAPQVYAKMDLAFDLCEFLTYRLTGKIARSMGSACFKGLWSQDLLFPPDEYLNGLRPGFAEEYKHLMRGTVCQPGDCIGMLHADWCQKLGLNRNIAVATGVLDGHTALVALGALQAGDAALVVGTSNVLTIQTKELKEVEGICGIALDGLTPGLYGIDSGQGSTGDMLEWYMKNAVGTDILTEASTKGISPHSLLAQRVERPWENKVIAADWWNGSRNAPCDLALPGIMSGLTLATKPEEIYLALLQSIACGTREVMEQCASYGVKVTRLVATGGITVKNPLLMQEYANLLGQTVSVGQFTEGPALGAAIFAAVAAGIYKTPVEAYKQMGVREFTDYEPDWEHREAYELLYQRNHALRQLAIQLPH